MRSSLILLGLGLLAGCGGATQLEVVSDDCLEDAAKVYPGECGCGVPEERCVPLKAALEHRYAFDGIGSVAVDDVGGPDGDGVIVNRELAGTGQLQLLREGPDEQYVDLPDGIVSQLRSATFEAWLVWDTPGSDQFWERIFDFGVSTAGEDVRAGGESYLFFAPAEFRTAYLNTMIPAEIQASAETAFPTDTLVHLAVVVDANAQQLVMYLDAEEKGRALFDQPLSAINDVNNWLGRSQFVADTRFGGTFLEFRIYSAALSEQQLRDSLALGDSPFFLQPMPDSPPEPVTQVEP
ncbi:MAG TPA: LamG domain-containing protein [Polyangiaceae bacterium]